MHRCLIHVDDESQISVRSNNFWTNDIHEILGFLLPRLWWSLGTRVYPCDRPASSAWRSVLQQNVLLRISLQQTLQVTLMLWISKMFTGIPCLQSSKIKQSMSSLMTSSCLPGSGWSHNLLLFFLVQPNHHPFPSSIKSMWDYNMVCRRPQRDASFYHQAPPNVTMLHFLQALYQAACIDNPKFMV